MFCKECEKFAKTADGFNGVCMLGTSWQPCTAETECPFLKKEKKTCKMCSHFAYDTACMTAEADDDATECCGYEPVMDEKITELLFDKLREGTYSRENIVKICEEFEETDYFQFIKKNANL